LKQSINLTILAFDSMVLLTHLDVDLRRETAILSFLCGVGVLVVEALSARMKGKDGVGNSD
jgi:hypothetical protein